MADNKDEVENTIADHDNVKKYKTAGEVVNRKYSNLSIIIIAPCTIWASVCLDCV